MKGLPWAAWCGSLLWGMATAWDNHTTPLSSFFSRPDIHPPAMTVTLSIPEKQAPGYIFLTPYQELHAGPYIFDKKGNLVYGGFGEIGPYNAHNFHVCEYLGQPHLCMFEGNQMYGYARGHGIIMNQDYKIVKTVEAVGDVPAMDQHEFKLINGGETALVTIYQQLPYDLSEVDIKDGIGWVMNAVFQEINVTDNSLIFEWNSLNHVAPWTSYVYPEGSDIAGNGREPDKPWDYFHINSVDKSKMTGNYIISARHMGTIYNINATDGSIIWRLEAGGASDFICKDFNFSFQHDAQIRHENATHMLISLYDNASNNRNYTAPSSAGKFIALDFRDMTASLYRPSIHHPTFPALSASQGNTQLLPNDNVVQSYGSWPQYSESTIDGEGVWAARIGPLQGVVMSYRCYSYPWKSIPTNTKPALWTYSQYRDSMMVFYVSWNGCTETAHWNFYGTNDINNPYQFIGKTDRDGFETMYVSETHYMYTFAESLDTDGKSLRNSSWVQTFVPSTGLAGSCNKFNCKREAKGK